jgi:hypothetical protein
MPQRQTQPKARAVPVISRNHINRICNILTQPKLHLQVISFISHNVLNVLDNDFLKKKPKLVASPGQMKDV